MTHLHVGHKAPTLGLFPLHLLLDSYVVVGIKYLLALSKVLRAPLKESVEYILEPLLK